MYKPVRKVLEKIGDKGRYQWTAFFILFMINGFINFLLVGPTFIYMNPLFKCPNFDEPIDES